MTVETICPQESAYINEKNLRKTLANIHKRIKGYKNVCLNPSCLSPATQKCHVLSKNTIKRYAKYPNSLSKVTKDRFQAMFPGKEGRNFFKQFSIKDEPTFKGFCNNCDHKLFFEADNYVHKPNNEIPKIVLLQMHYRQVCYGIFDLKDLVIFNEEILKYTKAHHPDSEYHKSLLQEIIPKTLSVLELHEKIKQKCEGYLNKIKQGKLAPKMPRILLLGNQSNPLCFGRVGYYAYQYAYSEKQVLEQFFYYLPFSTFSSIVGEQGESHLVFTSLPEDASHLTPMSYSRIWCMGKIT